MSSAARGSIVRKGMGGAALVLLGGLAAGCSGDIQRFSSDGVITGSTANQRAIIKPPASQPYPGDVQPAPPLDATQDRDGTWWFRSDDTTRDLHRLTSWAVERDVRLDGLSVTPPSLEDVYLELTGDSA